MPTHPDRQFVEPKLAALYDAFCAGRPDFAFYLPLVMAAGSVLDVACGTGELLRLARAAGHRGRLCGLDPAAAMLACARVQTDVEWIQGDLATADLTGEFDLVVMTGHAFQVLLDDAEVSAALAAIASRLTRGGRFVFETRNPAAREWERWVPERAVEVVDAEGTPVRMAHSVDHVDGDRVSFTVTYTSPVWPAPETSQSTLRFLDRAALTAFLAGAGLEVEAQFGDWDRTPVTDSSPEIITVARLGPSRLTQERQSGFS